MTVQTKGALVPSPLTRTASVAALAVLVGFLTGCGDDDSPAAGDTPAATSAEPADEPTDAPASTGSDEGEGDDGDISENTIELSVDVCTLGAAVIEEQLDPNGMGGVTSAPAETALGFGPVCDWSGPEGELEVSVSTFDDWVDPDTMDVGEELPGLGDEAVQGSDGTVAWRRDDISVRVRPVPMLSADTVAIAEAVDADLQASGT